MATGLALFGLSYGAVVAIGAADKFENRKGYLLMPVFGPAFWISARDSKHDGEASPGFIIFGAIFDAAFQIGGIGAVLREIAAPPKPARLAAIPISQGSAVLLRYSVSDSHVR